MFQILVAYSRIARSDENQPMRDVFRIADFHQLDVPNAFINPPLRTPIIVEVGSNHKMIITEQRIAKRMIQIGLIGRKSSVAKTRNCLS